MKDGGKKVGCQESRTALGLARCNKEPQGWQLQVPDHLSPEAAHLSAFSQDLQEVICCSSE